MTSLRQSRRTKAVTRSPIKKQRNVSLKGKKLDGDQVIPIFQPTSSAETVAVQALCEISGNCKASSTQRLAVEYEVADEPGPSETFKCDEQGRRDGTYFVGLGVSRGYELEEGMQSVIRAGTEGIDTYDGYGFIQITDCFLGEGSSSHVRLAICKITGKKMACKMIKMEQMKKNERMQRMMAKEITCLNQFDSDLVVRFEGLLITSEYFCILLQYVEGVELFDFMVHEGTGLHGLLAKDILRQVGRAIELIHSQNVAHRDLKLENIMMYRTEGGEPKIKLVDFGFASHDITSNIMLMTCCGSQEYAAPEILMGRTYDPRSTDAWSFGVIMYAVLVGRLPFQRQEGARDSARVLLTSVVNGFYRIPDEICNDAKAIIKGLLQVCPLERLSVTDALSMDWFQ